MLENWCGVNWEDLDKNFAWIVSDKKTDLALGIVLLLIKRIVGNPLWTRKKFQGQGFMQESLKAVITYLKIIALLKELRLL